MLQEGSQVQARLGGNVYDLVKLELQNSAMERFGGAGYEQGIK